MDGIFSNSDTSGSYTLQPKADSVIVEKFPNAQFKIQIHSSDYKVYGDEILYPNHKSQGDVFFNIELEETSNFCMSFYWRSIYYYRNNSN